MRDQRISLERLASLDRERFVATCGGFFEHSPWIAQAVWDRANPTGSESSDSPPNFFDSLTELYGVFMVVVRESGEEQQLALIRSHPDLVGRLAKEGRLTNESTREQRAAGLDALTPEEVELFDSYNTRYREKFGFPFVICARENRKESILRAFPARLIRDRQEEIAGALEEIGKIAWLRMADAIEEAVEEE